MTTRTGERSPRRDGRAAFSLAACAFVVALVFTVLVANGRGIEAGDTRPTERVAASLVHEGDLDLDEYPEVREPFARRVGEHYVSIYPVLSGVLAAPVFFAASRLFPLDERGCLLAGKIAASLFSSLAAAFLFLAVKHRRSARDALWAALLFALGTSVWSTSQALWQHPAAVLFLCLALLCVVKAEEDPAWAGRAGLPLALAVAARHADVALVAALAVGVALRWPRRLPWLALWAVPPAVFVAAYHWVYFGSPLRHGFSGTLGRFSAPWGEGPVGLLLAPAKGLFVFTPIVLVALVGLVRAWRGGDRWLAGILGAAAAAHWLLMGRWLEWHGGHSFGPRMMTDALPLLAVFLPEGLARLPRLGVGLAAVSVGVQALGAFADDGRWERLYQSPPAPRHRELWQVASSPIPFYLRQRVLILSVPWRRDGRVVFLEHRLVVLGPTGSRIDASGSALRVRGEPESFGDVHLLRGARVREGRIWLRGRSDGLFLRAREEARRGPLTIVVKGEGGGYLYVGETRFTSRTHWSAYPIAGPFEVDYAYDYARSSDADLMVSIGRARGWADITSVEARPRASGGEAPPTREVRDPVRAQSPSFRRK